MRLGQKKGQVVPMKACTRCKVVLPREAFGKTGRSTNEIRAKCKPCQSALARAWNLRNRARSNATARRYKKRNPHIYKAWCEQNREYLNAYAREWRKKYPDYWHYKGGQRAGRARAKWANEFFINEAYDLAKRRAEATGIPWEVDHVVPLHHPLVSGLHVENNLAVIPMVLNRSKGNRVWPDMPGAD